MKYRAVVVSASLALMLTVAMMVKSPAWGEFLKKQFIICKDQGQDVLCDSVVVKKDDFVIRLLKQKGEIAHDDFPKFLAIFQRLNPSVQNIDLIYPGQRIMVPLKLIEPGTLEGQSLGTVTIPLITITNAPAKLQQNSMGHVVVQGDSISALISRNFGQYNTQSYKEAVEIFKYLNPQIKDLNRIQVGQTIQLPTPKVKDVAGYPELFDRSGKLVVQDPPPAEAQKPVETKPAAEVQAAPVTVPKEVRIKIAAPAPAPPKPLPASPPPAARAPKPFVPKPVAIPAPMVPKPVAVPVPAAPAKTAAVKPEVTEAKAAPAEKSKETKSIMPPTAEVQKPLPSIFKKAAGIFNANLLDKGEYFFPRQGSKDLRVDLSATPVMEFPSGFRLLFAKQNALPATDQKVIASFWKNLTIVTLSYDAPLRELLSVICGMIDSRGCENRVAFNDNGVMVTVRGDYIFNASRSVGKTCVTLIDREVQQMPAPIRRYLQEKQIIISEWIDSEYFFGQVRDLGGKTRTPFLPPLRLAYDAARPAGFVKEFAAVLGLRFQEKVEITFPYAGFQVKAYACLLSIAPGREMLVDFGDLQGDAIKSIEATGFQVLQIKPQPDAASVITALLNQLPVQQKENPVFWAADRAESSNTSLQIPGQLIFLTTENGQRGVLLTDRVFDENLLAFLAQAGIQTARISNR
ncbi:MAG: LysM peptidoglycan-binding domain-containing protein [Desulfobacteraceae bacterium]|nr:MAG: LysM peptidoglycan-binding domain-containing protein [Desulfobacteraceae bacterium]